MPIYEFNCRKCGKKIEILLMAGEEPVCSGCGSDDLERLFSVFASPGLSGGSQGCSCSSSCSGHQCSSCRR